MPLAEEKCSACTGAVAAMPVEEAEARLREVPGWKLVDDGCCLERRFKFNDFISALSFVQRVGHIAEEQNHHPDLCFGWGYCQVKFQTHKVKGLTQNDFIMAAKVNEAQ